MTIFLAPKPTRPLSCTHCPVRAQAMCRGMPDEHLEALEAFKLGDRFLHPSSHLFMEGQSTNELYHLVSGWVMSYTLTDDGKRRIIDFALPGALLGYQRDLSGPANHALQCLTPVRVCAIPKGRLFDLLRDYPELAITMAKDHAQTLDGVRDQLTNVTARTARRRIAHFLLQLFQRSQNRHPSVPGEEIRLPINQDHIADALGLTNVYVSKTLRELREDGLMVFRSGCLRIEDPKRFVGEVFSDPLDDNSYRRLAG